MRRYEIDKKLERHADMKTSRYENEEIWNRRTVMKTSRYENDKNWDRHALPRKRAGIRMTTGNNERCEVGTLRDRLETFR